MSAPSQITSAVGFAADPAHFGNSKNDTYYVPSNNEGTGGLENITVNDARIEGNLTVLGTTGLHETTTAALTVNGLLTANGAASVYSDFTVNGAIYNDKAPNFFATGTTAPAQNPGVNLDFNTLGRGGLPLPAGYYTINVFLTKGLLSPSPGSFSEGGLTCVGLFYWDGATALLGYASSNYVNGTLFTRITPNAEAPNTGQLSTAAYARTTNPSPSLTFTMTWAVARICSTHLSP
jgi:hypothetical protein